MAAVKSSNTRPELLIRRSLHAAGLRYRLHSKHLPGKPDLVFPRYNVALFVNGCFWHRHSCHLFKWPATRQDFWRKKIDRNVVTDQKAVEALLATGWRVAIVWECALKGRTRPDFTETMQQLIAWIHSGKRTITIRGSS
jgi:DNA mismatch endonuclease (patch repair protein)